MAVPFNLLLMVLIVLETAGVSPCMVELGMAREACAADAIGATLVALEALLVAGNMLLILIGMPRLTFEEEFDPQPPLG